MYKLPKLPYAYDAFGSYISKDIMELHHSKHHQTYIDKLNAALDQTPDLQESSLESLLQQVDSLPKQVRTAIRNHGGGHYNHTLFWQFMTPTSSGEPSGELSRAINEKYGSFQKFVDDFSAQALGVFGSGWVWLLPDLTIMTTPNQDSPLNFGAPAPILGLDVWEHAYYLDYTYNRADYIAAWWHIVNWDTVARRYTDQQSSV